MKKQKTQWKVVLEHLKTYGSITSMDAIMDYHITRLAAVIFKLRKLGYEIDTVDRNGKNEYGIYTFAEYRLIGEKADGE